MKKLLLNIIAIIILLGSGEAFSQSQNNRRQTGLDKDMGIDSKYQAPMKRESVDIVKITTDNMTEKLKLDTFQSAIVRNAIEDFIKKTNDIVIENIPNEAKAEKSKIARENMDSKIAEVLTEKQKIAFQELKNSDKEKPKKKKRKKDKNDSEE
jgi:hypothetical protein